MQPEKEEEKKILLDGTDPFGHLDLIIEKKIAVVFKMNKEEQMQELIVRIYTSKTQQRGCMILLSENDLFFMYKTQLFFHHVNNFSMKYQLKVENVVDVVLVIEKNLLQIARGEKTACLQLISKKQFQFSVFKELNSKIFTVFSLNVEKQADDKVKILAAYRYGCLQEEIAAMQHKIQLTKEKVKLKNPYLLTFINKI